MEEPGFAAVVELLVKLHRQGARIEEVPMVLDSSRRKGASRMRVVKTTKAYLRLMAHLGPFSGPVGTPATAGGRGRA